MNREPKHRLPVPLGELLDEPSRSHADAHGSKRARGPASEESMRKQHEDELWARISVRRTGVSRAQATLPVPVARALVRGGDAPSIRLKHWRAISARRGASSLRSRAGGRTSTRAPGRTWQSGALAGGLCAVAALLALMFWRGNLVVLLARGPTHLAPSSEASPVRPALGQALTLASGAPLEPVEAAQREVELVLTDASHIRLAPGARLVPLASTESRLDVLLERGNAAFSVTPGGPRRWTVAAGLVRVEVVGTEFRVARQPNQVEVTVSHGIVLVSGPGVPHGVQRLTAGQALRVESAPTVAATPESPSVAAPASAPASVSSEVTAPEQETRVSPVPAASLARPRARFDPASSRHRTGLGTPPPPTPLPSPPPDNTEEWRNELRAGRYETAYRVLGADDFTRTVGRAETAEELLDLADVARLSGHARDAVFPLTRLLDEFAQSPHAAVAAFTLGRALLDQLHDARGAAGAFERAISMRPPHALLEDCHARLVQAYARTGSQLKAEQAAASYRLLFPNGRHLADLERWLRPD